MALYERIYSDILHKIKTGHYKVGDMLPPESEMEHIYSVSRAPVRQALAKLENLNLINRERGKGTRVLGSEITHYKVTLSGFGDQLASERNSEIVYTLSVDTIEAGAEISEILQIPVRTQIVKTTRLRKVHNDPVFFLNHYCHLIDRQRVAEEGDIASMRYLLIDKFGLDIAYVEEQLMAVMPDESIASAMHLKEDHPVLKVMRTSYDKEHHPLEYTEYYVKSENWHYKVLYGQSEKDIYV